MANNQRSSAPIGAKVVGGTGAAGAGLMAALALVSMLEGRSLTSYLDSGGVPTICDGETKGVKMGQTRTNKECDALLAGSLGQALAVVDRRVLLPINPIQRAGLGSFVYNVGRTAFANSTALKLLNAGRLTEGCAKLKDWVLIKTPKGSTSDQRDGKIDGYKDCRISANNCRGLARRRDIEYNYCVNIKGEL